jgi:hypothetical protein
MKTAHFEYKCRRCGAIELNPHMGLPDGESRATIQMVNAMMGRSDQPQSPQMFSLHPCSKTECGLSDLIGYHVTDD